MTLFAPPADIDARVFARLPDRLRKESGSSWSKGNRPGMVTDSFLEGPSFDREGNLWLVDIPNGRILRLSADGKDWDVVTEYDGWPNGLKFHADGRAFIADYRHGVMVLDPKTGALETVVGDRYSEGLLGVNDLHFASNGDLYFTDQGQTGLHDPRGRVFRLTADGRVDKLLDNGPSPNGLVLTPQENWLYVAMTRANAIWRLPLMPDGHVSKVGQFIQLSGGHGPDGLAIDETGGLVVAHFGLGSVWHFSPLGEPLHRIRSPLGLGTTNVAFGGPDRRTLFITESESGSILAADLPVAGQPMFGPTR